MDPDCYVKVEDGDSYDYVPCKKLGVRAVRSPDGEDHVEVRVRPIGKMFGGWVHANRTVSAEDFTQEGAGYE